MGNAPEAGTYRGENDAGFFMGKRTRTAVESKAIDARTTAEMAVMGSLKRLQAGASEVEALAYQLAEDAILKAVMARPNIGTDSVGAEPDAMHSQTKKRLESALRVLTRQFEPEKTGKLRELALETFVREIEKVRKVGRKPKREPVDWWEVREATQCCEAIQRAVMNHLPPQLRTRRWTDIEIQTARTAIEKWPSRHGSKWNAVNALLRMWGLHTSDKRSGGTKTSGAVHQLAIEWQGICRRNRARAQVAEKAEIGA